MPYYDKRRGDLVIRVVYDGAPEAGKTTNVRQLAEMLSLQRRGQIVSPGTVGRRTEFFDWMDFEGGFVDGHRLRCQLLTVPGQPSLLRRRRYLLQTADAVIFVADSHPLLVEENRDAFGSLEAALSRVPDPPVSIVLQANKQDRSNAVAPDELARRMSTSSPVPVVGASAHVGQGVRQTFLLAVRLAADRIRALVARGALGDGERAQTSAVELYRLMLERETDALFEAPRARAPSPARPALGTAIEIDPATTAAPLPAPPCERSDAAPPRITFDAGITKEPVPADDPGGALADPEDLAARISRDTHAAAPAPVVVAGLPDPLQIPAGCVWPPATGRAICAAAHDATRDAVRDGNARWLSPPRRWAPADALELHSPRGVVLHTRREWSWASLEAARLALLAEVRAVLPLRPTLPPNRALALAADGDAWRLWVVSPDLSTLADEIASALESSSTIDSTQWAGRCLEAWNAIHDVLGADADALGADDVAWTARGWVVLAFGEPIRRIPTRDLPWCDNVSAALLRALVSAGAWPTLRTALAARQPAAA